MVKRSAFNYTDYRKFLTDFFDSIKSKDPELTIGQICTETGIKSPDHLSLINQGKTNISIDLAGRFAAFFKLKQRETRYFLTMVQFNQEEDLSQNRASFSYVAHTKEYIKLDIVSKLVATRFC